MIVHGIPGNYRLARGDVLAIDVGVTHGGWVVDAAVTVPIGPVTPIASRLLAATRSALFDAVEQCRPGKHLGDLGAAVQARVEPEGFAVVRSLVGHGVGRSMHEDPQVPNFGRAGSGVELAEGMVLAIEPMITAGSSEIRMGNDGWAVYSADGSLAAHFEHTVAVTAEGPRILTPWHLEETGRQAA
jgi:methionyl aminopeptidase